MKLLAIVLVSFISFPLFYGGYYELFMYAFDVTRSTGVVEILSVCLALVSSIMSGFAVDEYRPAATAPATAPVTATAPDNSAAWALAVQAMADVTELTNKVNAAAKEEAQHDYAFLSNWCNDTTKQIEKAHREVRIVKNNLEAESREINGKLIELKQLNELIHFELIGGFSRPADYQGSIVDLIANKVANMVATTDVRITDEAPMEAPMEDYKGADMMAGIYAVGKILDVATPIWESGDSVVVHPDGTAATRFSARQETELHEVLKALYVAGKHYRMISGKARDIELAVGHTI